MKLRVAGVMSGTSLDGIDVALVDLDWGRATRPALTFLGALTLPYSKRIRERILGVSNRECHTRELARLHWDLGALYANAIEAACAAARVDPASLHLVGCHGQTIYHEGGRATLQIGEAAVIAERLHVETISNFRAADVAAGGQGAPLVPWFDWLMLTDKKKNRAAVNIGGIGNVHALPANGSAESVFGFDSGPGNMVIDQLVEIATAGKQRYDKDARLARKGHLQADLLDRLLKAPFYRQPPPKSVGREQYGPAFIARLQASGHSIEDLLATATAFTAATISLAIGRFVEPHFAVDECLVSGGGVHNPLLMAYLAAFLPTVQVKSLGEAGIDPDAKEAIAFAVFAAARKLGKPANLPSVTGARRPAMLGAANSYS
jgi:anhydro-N-acetylmuramic acid kinase